MNSVETIYIETSSPSAYFEDRAEANMLALRDWTRDWWDNHRHRYHLLTIDPVLDELARADHPFKQEKIKLLSGVELLPIPEGIEEIVEVYVKRHVMPRDPVGDALHLALASYHKCDVLLTWNCQHLANLNKLGHIRRVNTLLDLHVPQLVTPLELIGEDCL